MRTRGSAAAFRHPRTRDKFSQGGTFLFLFLSPLSRGLVSSRFLFFFKQSYHSAPTLLRGRGSGSTLPELSRTLACSSLHLSESLIPSILGTFRNANRVSC